MRPKRAPRRHSLYPLGGETDMLGLVFAVPGGRHGGRQVVEAFLDAGLEAGVFAAAPVIGHALRAGCYIPILADGRRALLALVCWSGRLYATEYAVLPDRRSLARWHALVVAHGGVPAWQGGGSPPPAGTLAATLPDGEAGDGAAGGWLQRLDRAVSWCPGCGGLNPPAAARCLWCGVPLPHLVPSRSLPR